MIVAMIVNSYAKKPYNFFHFVSSCYYASHSPAGVSHSLQDLHSWWTSYDKYRSIKKKMYE